MGYRLHVAKKYEVEYALGDAFNYKVEEFHNLLSACDASYSGESWDSDFEVTKDDWEKVIDTLKHLYDMDEDAQEEIKGAIDDLGSTTDEVIHMLEYYLKRQTPATMATYTYHSFRQWKRFMNETSRSGSIYYPFLAADWI